MCFFIIVENFKDVQIKENGSLNLPHAHHASSVIINTCQILLHLYPIYFSLLLLNCFEANPKLYSSPYILHRVSLKDKDYFCKTL